MCVESMCTERQRAKQRRERASASETETRTSVSECVSVRSFDYEDDERVFLPKEDSK